MTTGLPYLYPECRNGFIEKGTCHVNNYVQRFETYPIPSYIGAWVDHPSGYRSNCCSHLDTNRPGDRAAEFENQGMALDLERLPIPIRSLD